MFHLVLVYLCSFSLLHFSSLVHGTIRLNDGPTAGHRVDASYLHDRDKKHTPDPLHKPVLLPMDSVENSFLMEGGSYDEEVTASMQLQERAMRSPRRCIPHQQSCLGYPLPCCDPCDTCYCRFFNAICYCRRVGHTCLAGHA